MYKISKDTDGIILLCHDCSHVERINSFNESLGSPRTGSASNAESLTREARRRIGAEAHSKELTGSWSSGDKRDGTDSPTTVISIDDRSC
jgi:hypothetical protein